MAGMEWLVIYIGAIVLALASISGFGLARLWEWLRAKDKDKEQG